MTTTAQLQVYDAAAAALLATPALAGGRVYTMDTSNKPMPADVSSQIRLYLDRTMPAPLLGGQAPVNWASTIYAECTARSASGVSALRSASLLAAQVQQRLLEDAALQAMVQELTPAPMEWAEDEADTSVVACRCIFTVVHRAPYSNLIT